MKIEKTDNQIRIEYEYVVNDHCNTAEIFINAQNNGRGYYVLCKRCNFPELENFSAETWNCVKNKIQAHEKDVEIFRQSLEQVWKNICEVIS